MLITLAHAACLHGTHAILRPQRAVTEEVDLEIPEIGSLCHVEQQWQQLLVAALHVLVLAIYMQSITVSMLKLLPDALKWSGIACLCWLWLHILLLHLHCQLLLPACAQSVSRYLQGVGLPPTQHHVGFMLLRGT